MDALDVARLQFALTTSGHFLFVILTLGLAPLVAFMQTRWVITGNPVHKRMTRFWGQLYLINYALGIVTGIIMEFQFGLNWSGLSRFAGDVFGTPLVVETLAAFFFEAIFLGVWIFGWDHLPKGVHLASIWLVTIAAYASAYWIIVANGFLQHPVGYERTADGSLRLTDLGALLTNPSALYPLNHIFTASAAVGGFFIAAVSAWHFLRRTPDVEFFRRSLRLGVVVGYLGVWISIFTGFAQLGPIVATQPAKKAALDGDAAELAQLQAELATRFGPGSHTPPDWIAVPFQLMFNIGTIWTLIGLVALILLIRNWIERVRPMLYLLVYGLPVLFVAAISGWLVREVGRQPWVVYEQLRTSEAVSSLNVWTVTASMVGFVGAIATLAVIDYVLLARTARRGPDAVTLGAAPEPAADDEADALPRLV